MTYENLLAEAEKENVYVIENAKFQSKADGLINNDVIGINRTVRSNAKRTCILAEELGHYHTTSGDILDQSSVCNRKQEHRARLWAYNKLIGLQGIIKAYNAGCQNYHETAEYLDVTEEFLKEAITCYKNQYGSYTKVDNFMVVFEPSIAVIEFV